MNIKELKLKAREISSKNKLNFWKPVLWLTLFSFIISFVIALIFEEESVIGSVLQFLTSFAIIPASIGVQKYYLNLVNGREIDIIEAFKEQYTKKPLNLILQLSVAGLLISLGSFLIVPGIILSCMYSQIAFIFADDPEDNIYEGINAIKASKKMMDGHKTEYFLLMLSFLGWYLLSCLTLGILLIWTLPYFNACLTLYYQELKKLQK